MKVELSKEFLAQTGCKAPECAKRPWNTRGLCYPHRMWGFAAEEAVCAQYIKGVLMEDIANWHGITSRDVREIVLRRRAAWARRAERRAAVAPTTERAANPVEKIA